MGPQTFSSTEPRPALTASASAPVIAGRRSSPQNRQLASMDLVRVGAGPINEVHRLSGSRPPRHTACHDEEEDEGRDNEALGEDGSTPHAPSGGVGMYLDLEYAVNRPRLKYAAAAF
jgi:hypothetical protein